MSASTNNIFFWLIPAAYSMLILYTITSHAYQTLADIPRFFYDFNSSSKLKTQCPQFFSLSLSFSCNPNSQSLLSYFLLFVKLIFIDELKKKRFELYTRREFDFAFQEIYIPLTQILFKWYAMHFKMLPVFKYFYSNYSLICCFGYLIKYIW